MLLNNKLYIQSYCKIRNSKVSLNGNIVFEDNATIPKSFFKSIYKNLELDYPKFFKMDNLSKLAFLAAEIVLKDVEANNKNIGIVFSNKASSLDTDRAYQNSINDMENYFPSPSVFVYTLPNIGIGEICIKHQLKSENGFFVFEKFNATFHYMYVNSLVLNKKCDTVLSGWVNFDKGNYEAFLYLVSEKVTIKHTKENLNKLYKD